MKIHNFVRDAQKPKRPKKPQGKQRGRKRLKREFDQTKVGFFLKHEAPIEYELLCNKLCSNRAPSADLIEQIGYSSLNPLFKKAKFRRALIEYRKYGLYSGKPIETDAKTELFYIQLRRRLNAKLSKY